MNPLRRLLASTAAVLFTAAVGVVVPGAVSPAAAAACTGATGVTVVVDYKELGGVQAGCASGSGGKNANQAFADAGFDLSYVRNDPAGGFVCRVAGLPGGSVCGANPPSNAYWGLWYSNGTSGTWTYATRGVNQLMVPDGSFVAFSWHQGAGRAQAPAPDPVRSSAPSEPVKTPKPKPSKTPAKPKPTKSVSAAPATPTSSDQDAPSDSASPSATAKDSESPTEVPSEPSEPASPTAAASSEAPTTAGEITDGPPEGGTVENADDGGSDDGLPVWIPIVAVLLVAAAGGTVVVRRRAG